MMSSKFYYFLSSATYYVDCLPGKYLLKFPTGLEAAVFITAPSPGLSFLYYGSFLRAATWIAKAHSLRYASLSVPRMSLSLVVDPNYFLGLGYAILKRYFVESVRPIFPELFISTSILASLCWSYWSMTESFSLTVKAEMDPESKISSTLWPFLLTINLTLSSYFIFPIWVSSFWERRISPSTMHL